MSDITYTMVKGVGGGDAITFSQGLVSYWPMSEDQGSVAYDHGGGLNTATFTNAPTWVLGKFGSGVKLVSGSNEYLSVLSAGFPTGANNNSCFAWVYWTGAGSQYIFAYGTWVGHGARMLYINGAGNLAFFDFTSVTDSGISMPASAWTFVGYSINGTSITFYVNGTSATKTLGGTLNTVLSICNIGGYNNGGAFDGTIGTVWFFNFALSAGQATTLSGFVPAT